jgi:hypothetical protein
MTILCFAIQESLHNRNHPVEACLAQKANRPLMRSFIIPVRGKTYVKTISDGCYTIVSLIGAWTKFNVDPAFGLFVG